MSFYKPSDFIFLGEITNNRPYFGLLLGLLLMFFSYLFFTLFSLLLAIPVYSITWEELTTILNSGIQNADISLVKFLQVFQTIGLFLVPAIALNYLIFNSRERFLRIGEMNSSIVYLLLILILVVSIPFISKLIQWNGALKVPEQLKYIEDWMKQMEEQRNTLTVRMLAGDKFTGLLLNLGIIAVLPALGEEFIFRGVLQTLLTKWFKNTHLAIFIAAFLFSSIHLQFYGFIPRLVLGLFFGYLFFWSKNIWLAVWAHLINNALAIILMFLGNKGNINIPEILTENHHVSMIEFGISLCMIVILTGILYSTTKRARRTIIKDDIKIS